jgi:hypothetical protein
MTRTYHPAGLLFVPPSAAGRLKQRDGQSSGGLVSDAIQRCLQLLTLNVQHGELTDAAWRVAL